MSEKPISMPNIDSVRWNTGPSAETKTEPTSGKKNTGYAFEDVPPYDEWNWEMHYYYQMLLHLQGIGIREFETLNDACTASDLEENHLCRIRRADDGGTFVPRNERFTTQILSPVTAAGSIDPDCVVTDGLFIYYAYGVNVYAINAETGASAWSYTAGVSPVTAMAVDGAGKVYIARSATTNNLQRLANDDGGVEETVSTGTAIVDIDANEWFVAIAQGSGIEIRQSSSLSTTLGTYSHGAAVAAVAVDEEYVYIGGTQGTGSFDVRKVRQNGTLISSRALNVPSGTPVVLDIVTDGEHVYVAVSSTDYGANAWMPWANTVAGWVKLNRWDLTEIAYSDGTAYFTGGKLRVDDHYVYHGNNSQSSYIYDKHTCAVLFGRTDGSIVEVDPVSYIMRLYNGGSNDKISRYDLDHNTRLLARTGNDTRKRPYHKILVPLGPML
jgi:hypothetical protein